MSDDDALDRASLFRAHGIEPYPVPAYGPVDDVSSLLELADDCLGREVRVAGRVLSVRHASSSLGFFDLLSEGSRLQVMAQDLEDEDAFIMSNLSLGDFVGIVGEMVRTKRGELSVRVSRMTLLGIPLNVPPIAARTQDGRTVRGASDVGLLRRHRHLAFLNDPRIRDAIFTRAKVIREIRQALDEAGFLELTCPTITPYYGGAAATPFTTNVASLGEHQFLRISPELELKRALVGGLERVYCMGPSFRNEDLDATHSPEFWMIEWYEAYSDYDQQMVRFEELVARIAIAVHGDTKFTYSGREVDVTTPWQRVRVIDALSEHLGVDVAEIEQYDLDAFGEVFTVHHPDGRDALEDDWGVNVVTLFEALCEEGLSWGPVHVIDHPASICPLTKRSRYSERYAERFEPFLCGMEIGNSYSELNDPSLQRILLETDSIHGYASDEYFLQAMDDGMPQAGGTGLGVDRICQIMADMASIHDVLVFPMQKRLQND